MKKLSLLCGLVAACLIAAIPSSWAQTPVTETSPVSGGSSSGPVPLPISLPPQGSVLDNLWATTNRASLSRYALTQVKAVFVRVTLGSSAYGPFEWLIDYTNSLPSFAEMTRLVNEDGKFGFDVTNPEDYVTITAQFLSAKPDQYYNWNSQEWRYNIDWETVLFEGETTARPRFNADNAPSEWTLSEEESRLQMRIMQEHVRIWAPDVANARAIERDGNWANSVGLPVRDNYLHFPVGDAGSGEIVLTLKNGDRYETGAFSLVDLSEVELDTVWIDFLLQGSEDVVLAKADTNSITVKVESYNNYGVNPLIEYTTSESRDVFVSVVSTEGVGASAFTVVNLATKEEMAVPVPFSPTTGARLNGVTVKFPSRGTYHVVPTIGLKNSSGRWYGGKG